MFEREADDAVFVSLVYLGVILASFLPMLFRIIDRSQQRLIVGVDEIIFKSGWITKQKRTVPTNKIRTCSKTSGVLQRMCNTMTICITSSGDTAEISFWNLATTIERLAESRVH